MKELSIEEFSNRLIKIVPRLKVELSRYENQLLDRRDITVNQLLVLECLAACGQCKMNTLVKGLKVKFSAATNMIDRLVKSGFVIRERGEEDRRTVYVALTSQGRKVIDQVYQQRRKAFIEMFSLVSAKERQDYLRILEKIVENFSCHMKKGKS